MWVFYFFAAIVLLQSILSLRGGMRFLAFVRREVEAKRPLYMPFATVCVPCRGLDQGLRQNLAPLFAQHYPAYEIIFVSDRADDPALGVADWLMNESENPGVVRVRFVDAGRASESGQKVHNLRAAVAEADPASEVFVFVDTDARPHEGWLRALVAPLEDELVGATTGYRWFFPGRGGFASHLRSVWNASIASALGADDKSNFCWGGSTAIRRRMFERLDMSERWRGTLSDDYALTRALREERPRIRFVPDCLTASIEDCTFTELLEFTTRQIKITRVYAPHLWKLVLVSNLSVRPRLLWRPRARRRAGRAGSFVGLAARLRQPALFARRVEGILPPARGRARSRRLPRGVASRDVGAPHAVAADGGALSLQRARRRFLAPPQLARHHLRIEIADGN